MSTFKEETNRMLTVNDVAYLLNVHPGTIRRWEMSGQLKSFRFGSKKLIRFRKQELDGFLNQACLRYLEDEQFYQLMEDKLE